MASKSPLMLTFPQFARLPAELQSQVWRACYPRPGIHIFDVCFPTRANGRTLSAFEGSRTTQEGESRYNRFRGKVFLDTLEVGPARRDLAASTSSIASFPHDPSMYRVAALLSQTCFSAATESGITRPLSPSTPPPYDAPGPSDVNAVFLPGPARWLHYDNAADVLCLRFGAPGSISQLASAVLLGGGGDDDDMVVDDEGDKMVVGGFASGISDALGGIWSEELAGSLRRARRVAIDVAETWAAEDAPDEVLVEEIAYLACVLHKNLEVLYLMDYSWGRSRETRGSGAGGGRRPRVATEDGRGREADVVYGVGKTYREVADLGSIGWAEDHPTHTLIDILDDSIRSQQGAEQTFQGVRVLTCEDEPVAGTGTSIQVS